MLRVILAGCAILLCTLFACSKQNLTAQELTTRVVVEGRDIPWEIIWGSDGWIWMTEIGGKVSRLNPVTGQIIEVATINDIKRIGEGGLLGMALHPDFPAVPHVFLAYNYDDNGATRERIVRYEYNGTTLVNPFILIGGIRGSSIHNGCRLLFAPDKTLLITTGDASDQTLPQNHTSLNGKILRINPDGTFPADNPWLGSALYSTGHRNPQGITFGAQGKLYSSEHGPSTDDEVNIIEKGRNYGWPNVHGYCDLAQEKTFCEDSSVVEPIAAWTPTLAVCGLGYYNHSAIPEWNNSLLLLTLKAARLIQLKLSDDGSQIVDRKEYFVGEFGRLRDLCMAPDGRVFISTSNGNNNNKIIEIRGPDTQLQLSTHDIDFGTLRLSQTSAEQMLVLTNTGSQELTVTNAALSGLNADDFSIGQLSLPLVLAPQQEHTLTVRFQPADMGVRNATLRLSYPGAGSATESTVELRGRKSRKDVVLPAFIDLGIISAGSTLDTTLFGFFANTGEGEVSLQQISVEQPFDIILPNVPALIAQGLAEKLRLRVAPEAGIYQRLLTAIFDDGIQLSTVFMLSATTATSVQEVAPAADVLRILPVPATAGVEMQITTPYRGMAVWWIVDLTGRIVFRGELEIRDNQTSVFWNGSTGSGLGCPTGFYTAILEIDGHRHTVPVVIVR